MFKLTVPLSPAPYPINQITGIQLSGTNIVFGIPSIAHESYQLLFSSSLTPANWIGVPGAVVSNSIGSILTLTNFGGALQTQAFYRVMVSLGGIPSLASDNSAESAYRDGWINGSDGGFDFSAWILTATSTSGNSNGFFIGSSTNNAFGTSPGH